MTADGHIGADLLRRYVAGALDGPPLFSVETHVAACATCRDRLAAAVPAELVDRGWARLDAELDAPRRGPVEWVLHRLGVPEDLARLLAATPALRLSWLLAVLVTLGIGVAAAQAAESPRMPLFLLALVPLVAVAGVAAAFGPRVDPTYEIGLVAPLDTFRLVLLRAAAVLTTTVLLAGAAAVAAPDAGLRAAGWLAPALLLTLVSLALSPALGPVRAAAVTAATWLVALAATLRPAAGTSLLFEPAAQAGMGVAVVAAALAVALARWRFDDHHGTRPRPRIRRTHR